VGFRIIGAPAKPYPQQVVHAVLRAVQSVEGIAEAHMPQWFEAGLTEGAEQVLVVVLGRDAAVSEVVPPLLKALNQQLPLGPSLVVIPITGADGDLGTIRGTDTMVLRRPEVELAKRPWWKFW